MRRAAALADDRRVDVVHLILHGEPDEGHFKDHPFSLPSMRRHWARGLADLRGTLEHPDRLDRPAARLRSGSRARKRKSPHLTVRAETTIEEVEETLRILHVLLVRRNKNTRSGVSEITEPPGLPRPA